MLRRERNAWNKEEEREEREMHLVAVSLPRSNVVVTFSPASNILSRDVLSARKGEISNLRKYPRFGLYDYFLFHNETKFEINGSLKNLFLTLLLQEFDNIMFTVVFAKYC